MKKMQGTSVNLILTDPPYGIDEEVEARRNLNPRKYHPRREEFNRELTSFDQVEDYYEFTRSWMARIMTVMDVPSRVEVAKRLTPATFFIMPSLSATAITSGIYLAEELGRP